MEDDANEICVCTFCGDEGHDLDVCPLKLTVEKSKVCVFCVYYCAVCRVLCVCFWCAYSVLYCIA